MDLTPICSSVSWFSFPRARGDGPCARTDDQVLRRLPPRSRGWTRPDHEDAADFSASPALAGMDPSSPTSACGSPGFPRARGDGPSGSRGIGADVLLPPRSRGWTFIPTTHALDDHASPALAGMDLPMMSFFQSVIGFPRARGDGPSEKPRNPSRPELPPRSRGWTRAGNRPDQLLAASPALAGMDPRCTKLVCTSTGFPRARGDGPANTARAATTTRLPPRSRGWTRSAYRLAESCDASPALAGMDLTPPFHAAALYGFPRARGDGPTDQTDPRYRRRLPPRSRGWTCPVGDLGQRAVASPALAGMDPQSYRSRPSSNSFPRARGDGPSPPLTAPQPCWLPPRSRGWTCVGGFASGGIAASPALAGMDRSIQMGCWSGSRFPRARGDGPLVARQE